MAEPTVPRWAVDMAMDVRNANARIQELTAQIKEIKAEVDLIRNSSMENQRTLRGFNGTKGIIQRLELMETVISTVRDDFAEVKRASEMTDGFKYLSWQWIVEKLGTPLILTVMTFLLITICPAVIVLVYLLPNITKHLIPGVP